MPDDIRYITTPIYYVNDRPHIGHIYTTTICDAYARFQRFAGRETFFLTGTDEHGVKVEKSAQARQVTPKQLADENAAQFKRVLSTFDLTNDDFIRTTDAAHERQVQAFITRLLEAGHVYLGEFEGWYDEGQEEYYPETKAKELGYKSPVSKKPLTRAREKNYYFRLSAFQKQLEELFAKHPDFVRPEARRNEVLGRLREGLQDVPISRTNFTWGIPMPAPAEPGHVIYVWIDALMNYATALGLGEAKDNATRRAREKYWPATYHVIGKEILWFHAVIWPAALIALGLPPPRCVYAHSFWISEGQKMSKSLGNFIDLEAIQRYLHTYGLDAWRHYLITQGPLGAQDANFAASHFHEIYTSHLVNTVGNCASRVTAMITRYCDGAVPDIPKRTATTTGQAMPYIDWAAASKQATDRAIQAMEAFDLSTAVESAMELVRKVDGYINVTEPFKLAKDPAKKTELDGILYECVEAVRIASLLLWPILPAKMEELWKALGLGLDASAVGHGASAGTGTCRLADLARWGGMKPGTKVTKVALFPRVESPTTPVGAGAAS